METESPLRRFRDPLRSPRRSRSFSWPPGATVWIWANSLISSRIDHPNMTPLTQYGRMAEKHWRAHLPKLVRELEGRGLLHQMLLEAEERTKEELITLRLELTKQGLTAQQAHDRAWELVREKYILLPPES